MRNLKKFLALVLALMMAFSLMVTVNAASSSDFAADVNDAYSEAVQVLNALGVFVGDANGFREGDDITRAEVAAILCRATTGMVDAKDYEIYRDYAKADEGKTVILYTVGIGGEDGETPVVMSVKTATSTTATVTSVKPDEENETYIDGILDKDNGLADRLIVYFDNYGNAILVAYPADAAPEVHAMVIPKGETKSTGKDFEYFLNLSVVLDSSSGSARTIGPDGLWETEQAAADALKTLIEGGDGDGDDESVLPLLVTYTVDDDGYWIYDVVQDGKRPPSGPGPI